MSGTLALAQPKEIHRQRPRANASGAKLAPPLTLAQAKLPRGGDSKRGSLSGSQLPRDADDRVSCQRSNSKRKSVAVQLPHFNKIKKAASSDEFSDKEQDSQSSSSLVTEIDLSSEEKKEPSGHHKPVLAKVNSIRKTKAESYQLKKLAQMNPKHMQKLKRILLQNTESKSVQKPQMQKKAIGCLC